MRVEVEDRTSVDKILKVEIPPEETKRVVEEVEREYQRRAKIKGFREGKAPLYLVRKLFKEEIEERSIERLIGETLEKAIKEANLEPLLRPRIESFDRIVEGSPFTYSVLVEVRPEINLSKEDYIGLEVEREKDEVSEEEVERILNELRYSFSELKEVEDEIKERDAVVISFVAYDGENPIPGHEAQALYIDVGTGEFNEKVERELIGKRIGDRFTVEVEYPEDALNPLLAGKKVRYEIEVKEIYRRELEELTDEFLKKLNLGFESVEKLRESIRERLLNDKKRRNENKYRERLLEKIFEKIDFEVPARYVEIKFYQLVEQLRETLAQDGLSFEKLNLSLESLKKRLRPIAEKQAKEEILLEKIAEIEGISIPDEEIERMKENMMKGLGIPEEEAIRILQFNILPKMLAERTLQFLVENSKPIFKEE
ncbi:MAG: trigger factor [Thermodesulfobacterium sp.]|jgi:trigger factor|nr:trigger factor [Thermodesulfobacterium sp.]